MARMILKERQFEPTGVNLGDFESKDLETFDIQFKDSDTEDGGQSGTSNGPQSHVPDPNDPNPLEKKSKGSGSGGQNSNSNQNSNNSEKDDNEPEGLPDIPDTWDPYGQDLDDSDPDTPDPIDLDDSEGGFGGGTPGESEVDQPTTGGNGDDDGEGDTQTHTDGNSPSGPENDSQGENGQGSENGQDGEDSNSSSDGQDNDGSSQQGQEGGQPDNATGSNSSQNDVSNSQEGDSEGNSSSNSSNSEDKGSKSSSNQIGTDTEGGQDHEMSYDPNNSSLDDDDDDFDPSGDDIKSLSDLEKALDILDKSESSSSKEKRKAEESMQKDDERKNTTSSQQDKRDRDEEAAAAKELLSKAIQDKKERDRLEGKDEDNDSYLDESEDDILAGLGAGNLTTLFNPNTAHDWRVQLDRLFDKALGFDVVTNPNLVNKKIEDAPPGREDFDPVIKNIVVLLDYSGSMGAKEFKQVISHIDTMLKARKLTKTMFHIFPWGTNDVGVLLDRYTKCKGLMFKKTINAKFKSGSGGTALAPVIPVVLRKVHKPDAIIIMTDGEINDVSSFNSSPMCKSFIKKFKNRIIWALTIDGNVQRITEYDPSARSKKRYIKFKKGGHE